MKPNMHAWFILILAAATVLLSQLAAAQALTGTLIGTARDEQGAVVPGGQVRITSAALIGGPRIMPTSEGGQFRFPNLAPTHPPLPRSSSLRCWDDSTQRSLELRA